MLDVLGDPELYEPPGGSSPGFARYGDLEFTIRDDAVTVISLRLDGDAVSVPQSVSMVNFEDPTPDIDDVSGLLEERGVSWHRLELLSDEWRDAYCTERGVHLAFGEARACALLDDHGRPRRVQPGPNCVSGLSGPAGGGVSGASCGPSCA